MKRVVYLLIACFLITANSVAQEINWMSLDEAVAAQKKAPKKIMMDVYTNWCGPCKLLDKNTFHNADVVKYVNDNYYAVKFNGEGNDAITLNGNTFTNPKYNPANAKRRNAAHQLTGYLQISAYPTIVFFDEQAGVIAPIKGYQTPPQLELYLKMFKDDEHKDLDTQEKFSVYAKAFKAEFKG